MTNELPDTAFIELRTSDLLAHAWDLAIATGRPTDLDPELADGRYLAKVRFSAF